MPPKVALRAGDKVRVRGSGAFNPSWLKEKYPRNWHTIKFDGTVLGTHEESGKWRVRFDDDEVATLARKDIEFISRPAAEKRQRKARAPAAAAVQRRSKRASRRAS